MNTRGTYIRIIGVCLLGGLILTLSGATNPVSFEEPLASLVQDDTLKNYTGPPTFENWLQDVWAEEDAAKEEMGQTVRGGLHEYEFSHYLKRYSCDKQYMLESEWSHIQHVEPAPFRCGGTRGKKKAVYAFHPFWMGEAYYNYNYSNFSRIAYYGYLIDPETGNDLGCHVTEPGLLAHSWISSSLHNKAASCGSKVDLVVCSYDPVNNAQFFEDSPGGANARRTCIDKVTSLVHKRGHGVCLDIQKVDTALAPMYIQFVKELRESLLSNDSIDYEITMVLPVRDIGFPARMTYDQWSELDTNINRCILTGVSTYGSRTIDESPATVLGTAEWHWQQIDDKIDSYPRSMFEKTILEVPVHGNRWALTEEGDTTFKVLPLREIETVYPDLVQPFIETMIARLEYTNLKNLGGVALWSAGYADRKAKLSTLMANYAQGLDLGVDPAVLAMLKSVIEAEAKDTVPAGAVLPPPSAEQTAMLPMAVPVKPKTSFGTEREVIQHIVVFCIGVLLLFAIVGMVISLFYESAREVIFSKEYLIYAVMLGSVVLLIFLLRRVDIIRDRDMFFVSGILLGVVLTLILRSIRRGKRADERTP